MSDCWREDVRWSLDRIVGAQCKYGSRGSVTIRDLDADRIDYRSRSRVTTKDVETVEVVDCSSGDLLVDVVTNRILDRSGLNDPVWCSGVVVQEMPRTNVSI